MSPLPSSDVEGAVADAGPEDTALLEWPDAPEPSGFVNGVRYVRVITDDGPSWVSWFEVEVSGTWMQMGGDPFNLALGRPVEVPGSTDDSPGTHLVDGDHATPWNAGVLPPASLTVDLLMEAEITEIRLRISQMPSGPTQHELQLAGSDGEFVSTHTFSGDTQDGQWLVWPTDEEEVVPEDAAEMQPSGPVMEWAFEGTVADGGQHDAVRGPDDRVHLVSDKYYQIDLSGTVVIAEDPGDEHQTAMDFPPAIAVGDDHTVHLVTRHGGDWYSGHELRYRRRNAAGDWDRNYVFGTPQKRNYVVGVAWGGPDQVFLHSSQAGDNVWGNLHLWQAQADAASHLGHIPDIWRADSDSRMRATTDRLYLVSGKPDGGGNATYFLHGTPGPDLLDELVANTTLHNAGVGRSGFPDLYVDESGFVHVTYGADQTVFYRQYSPNGEPLGPSDQTIFEDLGTWHLSTGLSAVGASSDGQTVLAVALRSDGSKTAGNSDLMWAFSLDGGNTWNAPQDTGRDTEGGEGRSRPRVVVLGQKFFVLYRDKANPGISLATITLPAAP